MQKVELNFMKIDNQLGDAIWVMTPYWQNNSN